MHPSFPSRCRVRWFSKSKIIWWRHTRTLTHALTHTYTYARLWRFINLCIKKIELGEGAPKCQSGSSDAHIVYHYTHPHTHTHTPVHPCTAYTRTPHTQTPHSHAHRASECATIFYNIIMSTTEHDVEICDELSASQQYFVCPLALRFPFLFSIPVRSQLPPSCRVPPANPLNPLQPDAAAAGADDEAIGNGNRSRRRRQHIKLWHPSGLQAAPALDCPESENGRGKASKGWSRSEEWLGWTRSRSMGVSSCSLSQPSHIFVYLQPFRLCPGTCHTFALASPAFSAPPPLPLLHVAQWLLNFIWMSGIK